MATAEWIDRLGTLKYTSPSGVVSYGKFDLLSRSGGKKASTHELLNSDNAILQDQGNRIKSYPMNIYFTGDNGDTDADKLVDSLQEKYSADKPGILSHPRWGDIGVMPFEFEQNENYIKGAGIFRVTVDFKEVNISAYPGSNGINSANIISTLDTLQGTLEVANASIFVQALTAYAKFKSTVGSVVDAIVDGVGSVAKLVDDVYDEFVLLQDEIDYALSIGTSAIEIMNQVNSLIRLVTNIPSRISNKVSSILANITGSSLDTIGALADTLDSVTSIFQGNVNTQEDTTEQLNNAIMLQTVTSMITGCIIEASVYTTIDTRETASDIIDFIDNSFSSVEDAVSDTYQEFSEGLITEIFVPDHDTGLYLSELVGIANSYLISESFDLKAKKTMTLTEPSDALTLTWELYSDIDKLGFLILTNKLNDNEIIDTPIGREIVSYA